MIFGELAAVPRLLVFTIFLSCLVQQPIAWPIAFQKNSKSMPSIEVRLAPPEDPLPQVSASIQQLERQRIRVQEALMSKLEDVFNKMLDMSQREIQSSVDKAMKVFEDRNFLDSAVKGSLLFLINPPAKKKTITKPGSLLPSFREKNYKTTKDIFQFWNKSSVPLELLKEPGMKPSPDFKLNPNSVEKLAVDTNTHSDIASNFSKESVNPLFAQNGPVRFNLIQLHDTGIFNKNITLEEQGSNLNAHADNLDSSQFTPLAINNGPIRPIISFLQLMSKSGSTNKETTKAAAHEKLNMTETSLSNSEMKAGPAGGNVVGNIMKKLQNVAAPMVNVEVVDIFEPDEVIENKMKEIEQKRNDEEGEMIELAAEEFEQLTKITIQELDKNIQIQMAPYLVDSPAVGNSVSNALKKYSNGMGGGSGMHKPVGFRQKNKHSTDSSLIKEKEKANNKCLTIRQRFPHLKLKCPIQADKSGLNNIKHQRVIGNFLQLHSVMKSNAAPFLNAEQLNIKIAAADKAYPTVDQLVDDMEKKRDATERLERAKILELQLHLMRAQNEMIKDALHTGIARVIALVGQTAESIKIESIPAMIPAE